MRGASFGYLFGNPFQKISLPKGISREVLDEMVEKIS